MLQRIGIVISIVVLGLASVFVAQAANAQSANEMSTERCTQALAKVTNRIERLTTVRENRDTAYTRIQTKLTELITRAEQNSYTIDGLVESEVALKERIAAFNTAFDAYDQSLKALSDVDCSARDRSLSTALTAARADLRELRASSLATRTTVLENVLPELREYAVWLAERNSTEEQS